MENILRRFLIVCYISALFCGLLGYWLNEVSVQERVRLMNESSAAEISITRAKNSQDLSIIMFFSAPGIIILCYLAHFLFLGILNPLRLFKPIEIPMHGKTR